jgi:hypothetical protein
MNTYASAALAATLGLILAGGAPVAAQTDAPQARARVPISGSATGPSKATFAGTLHVERFAVRDDRIVVIGMITASVSDKHGKSLGSAAVGRVELPVNVRADAAVRAGSQGDARAVCGVLHLDVGAVNLNLLGVQFATAPITIDLSADDAEVLGQLICTALELVGNVVALVDVLNQILGLLTGLLGGIIPA